MSLTNAASHRVLLVTFVFPKVQIPIVGGQQADTIEVFRFTNNAENLTIDFQDYQSETAMTVELPQYDGVFEDKQATLRIRNAYTFLREMCQGRAFAQTRVTVQQLTWDPENSADNSLTYLWDGEIATATLNPEGAEGLVDLRLERCGGSIDRRVNPIASARCWKRFGDPDTCTVDTSTLTEYLDLVSVNGKTLTVAAGSASIPLINYWVGGRVNLNGAWIKIRRWDITDPDTFELAEYPPQSFEDGFATLFEGVRFQPGCDHLQGTCIFYQGNDLNWGGLGNQLPTRNPLFELPDD